LWGRRGATAGTGKEPDEARRALGVEDRRINPFLLYNPLRKFLENPNFLVKKFLRPGMNVADVGCGPGFYTIPTARAVGEEGKVYAVDFDPKALDYLRRRVEREGIRNVLTFVGSAADLNFLPSDYFDFVLSKDVLCCVTKHREAAEEMLRILKPGGRAYVSVMRGPKSDPRTVKPGELLNLFPKDSVVERGGGPLHSWFIIRK